jgi:hypothetical protein
MVGWVFAQAQSIVDMGFDQAFSIGLLLAGLITMYVAFQKKDAAVIKVLRETIEEKNEIISTLKEVIEKRNDQ